MPTYNYTVSGKAANDQTWTTEGVVATAHEGGFTIAIDKAMRDSFNKLTSGKAVYGSPGLGCEGPYRVVKVTIERQADA